MMDRSLLSGFQRVLRLVSCWALLIAAAAMAQATPSLASSQTLLKIEQLLSERQYAQAAAQCSSALQTSAGDVRLWTLQGMAYAGAGDLQKAITSYQRALSMKKDYLPALEGAAQAEYQRHSPQAEALLERVLVLRPADATTHAMLGAIEAGKNECDRAVAHFEKARTAIARQPAALMRYGVCLDHQGKPEEAIEVFQSAVALQPEDAGARYNLAVALWHARRFDDAAQAVQPVLAAGTTNENLLTLAADIDEARNDTPHAVEMLNRAIQANPRDVHAYLWLANIASDHASYKVGIDVLDAGIRILPREAQLFLVRGILLAQTGEFEKALDDFDAAHRLDPRLSFAGTAEGIVATQQHKVDSGIERFRRQVKEHPGSALDYYLLAESLRQQGADPEKPSYREALDAAKKAVKLDPTLTVAHELLADLYLSGGNAQQAAAECDAMLKTDPDNQETLYRLILALRKSDRRKEIPDLTRRLMDLRHSDSARHAHLRNFELTENAPCNNTADHTCQP